MRIIETKAYQFKELDEQTKEKAIDNYRYISVDDDIWFPDKIEKQIERKI